MPACPAPEQRIGFHVLRSYALTRSRHGPEMPTGFQRGGSSPTRQPLPVQHHCSLSKKGCLLNSKLKPAGSRRVASAGLSSISALSPCSPTRRSDEPPSQLLIFDQFEEIVTLDPTDQAGKAAFFAQLGAALRDRNRWALISLREDYVAALDPYLRHIPTRLSNRFRLDLLGVSSARQAIQQPVT